MVIVSTPSVAFDLGQLAYVLADGIYLRTPSGPAKIPGVPDAEVVAVKAWIDGGGGSFGHAIHGDCNPADKSLVIVIPVPAAPGGGA